MTIIRWVLTLGVFYYFQTQFGMWLGLLVGFIFLFTVDLINAVIKSYSESEKQKKRDTIRAENVLISIEAVEHNGQLIYLVYNLPNNKFLLQGLKINELATTLIQHFEGKNIFVAKGSTDIEPLSAAIKNYQT